VQAVTFVLGNETVRTPAAVAVPRAVPVTPALSLSLTRSAGLKPFPRIVSGFSFTIRTVAFAAAAGAAVATAQSKMPSMAATIAALPGVAFGVPLTCALT